VFETLGVAGIVISMLAYVPQVVHLGRQHCSAGISRRAWAMWLVSSLLVGTLAVHRRDLVFILLQLSTLTSAAVILTSGAEIPRNGVRSSRAPLSAAESA
jgi:uncharacterized protein with PQ loop repeat